MRRVPPAHHAGPARTQLSVEVLEDRTQPSAALHHLLVHPGESIQAAVDAAPPGATIDVLPGTYAEAVTIAKPGIQLVGHPGPHGSGVVLANPGGADDGIRVTAAGSGFELRDVTVRGFDENGVLLAGVDGFRLSRVTATDDGDYGLFPVRSTHGVVEDCAASGSRDTGIYVGQSNDVTVRGSTAFGNVVGFDVENCSDVRVVGNDSHDNAAGILVTLLPGLRVNAAADIVVAGNLVHDNNHVNFAEPGEVEGFLPSGIGILVLGADSVTVRDNLVVGNHALGIGIGSTLLLGAVAGLPPEAFAGIDPNPDGVVVRNNLVVGNGSTSPLPGLPGADLLWDGSGDGNVWRSNLFGTSTPLALPR
jgi:parallel beta-helix repeat protein